ncbi:MAG: GGDEF domain-containing protein, partial [Chloroflexi bacterium]|nr:GGDEF domain-containing protein [Chloroflexota bacterium]
TDGLTGAFNRRYLDEILAKELAHCARYPRGVSLIMLDMDHFKAYNDVNGHLAGDEALRRAAQIIHENVRVSDVPARYGGEEFAIVLPDTDQVGAFAAAEKIREAIAAQNFSAGTLTASLGVTTCVADDRASPDDVIARADQALYQAKNSGRNRVCVWNSAFAGSPSHHPNIPAAHNENSLDTDKH